jgi:AcrR family transcriptional regulator
MAAKNVVRGSDDEAELSTSERIVDAASAILREEGVAGISTRRIASRAGVNQALVHYHFGSIENLMLEVLRGIAVAATERVGSQYQGPGTFVEHWRDDLESTLNSEVQLGWGKAWLEIMAMVVNDSDLLGAYMDEFGRPNYSILKEAALRSLPPDKQADEGNAEGIAAFVSLLKAGLIVNSLLGRSPGEDRAVELATAFLKSQFELG